MVSLFLQLIKKRYLFRNFSKDSCVLEWDDVLIQHKLNQPKYIKSEI